MMEVAMMMAICMKSRSGSRIMYTVLVGCMMLVYIVVA